MDRDAAEGGCRGSRRPRTTHLLRRVDSHTLTTLMTSLTVLRKSCILAATRSAGEKHREFRKGTTQRPQERPWADGHDPPRGSADPRGVPGQPPRWGLREPGWHQLALLLWEVLQARACENAQEGSLRRRRLHNSLKNVEDAASQSPFLKVTIKIHFEDFV